MAHLYASIKRNQVAFLDLGPWAMCLSYTIINIKSSINIIVIITINKSPSLLLFVMPHLSLRKQPLSTLLQFGSLNLNQC